LKYIPDADEKRTALNRTTKNENDSTTALSPWFENDSV